MCSLKACADCRTTPFLSLLLADVWMTTGSLEQPTLSNMTEDGQASGVPHAGDSQEMAQAIEKTPLAGAEQLLRAASDPVV